MTILKNRLSQHIQAICDYFLNRTTRLINREAMAKSKNSFLQLEYFMGAYFHQDWQVIYKLAREKTNISSSSSRFPSYIQKIRDS